jgi:hypothetical protein
MSSAKPLDGSIENQRSLAAQHLRFALTDQQEIIRGTDVKSEVLGIWSTALLAIVVLQGAPSLSSWSGWFGCVAVICTLGAFFCVALSLWPRNDPWMEVSLGAFRPSRILFPSAAADPQRDIQRIVDNALNTDWVSELAYELSKLATIRTTKRFWVRIALALVCVAQLATGCRLFASA